MTFPIRRAGRVAFAFAAALAASTMLAPVHAQDARITLVQDDLAKRADIILKSVTESGGKVKYGALEKGDGKDGLVIKDLEITGPDGKTVKIERVEVRSFDWAKPSEPSHMDLSIRKLVVPSELLDKEAADLGITSLTVNADFAYAFDDAKKTFTISGIVVDVVELGELKLSLKLAGIASGDLKTALGGKGEDGTKLLAQLSIVGASISFKDKSLTQRMIRADAKKKGISEADAKKKMLEELDEQKKQAQDDATKEIIDLAVKFLNSPGLVEVAANPAAPANVMGAFMAVMASPATLKQMLGLTIAVK
ncbi:MAG: hypothetical protein U1F37_01830 [Alphaproteobacteria bacterium]